MMSSLDSSSWALFIILIATPSASYGIHCAAPPRPSCCRRCSGCSSSPLSSAAGGRVAVWLRFARSAADVVPWQLRLEPSVDGAVVAGWDIASGGARCVAAAPALAQGRGGGPRCRRRRRRRGWGMAPPHRQQRLRTTGFERQRRSGGGRGRRTLGDRRTGTLDQDAVAWASGRSRRRQEAL